MYYEKIMTYISLTESDENARYKSWDHCHRYFMEHRSDPAAADILSLHLAFYLASWGMLRGNAFLLQKDYRVHLPVVAIIQDPRYRLLWNCPAKEMKQRGTLDLITECGQRIRDVYREKTQYVNGKAVGGATVSDTLLTKILLGTFRCTPAYDRYFCSGVNAAGLKPSLYGRNSLAMLGDLYISNPEFAAAEKALFAKGYDYPPAKILDMCFWQIGYDADVDPGEQEDLLVVLMPEKTISRDPIPLPDSNLSVAEQVRIYLRELIRQASTEGASHLDVTASDVGKALGLKKSFPTICDAVYNVIQERDEVLRSPPSGKSSGLQIHYFC